MIEIIIHSYTLPRFILLILLTISILLPSLLPASIVHAEGHNDKPAYTQAQSMEAKLAAANNVYHATEDELKGTAYAVFNTDTGELDFIRSTETHSNGDTGTVKSISGGTYTGTIYTGFETQRYSYDSSSTLAYTPWYSDRLGVKKVKFVDAIKPKYAESWFYNFTNCTSIDLAKLDTSNVDSMGCMFVNCKSLTNLDVTRFDTSTVTDMISVFNGCSGLKDINVSSFDTSNVIRMHGMFNICSELTNLDVSHFDTSSVTDMHATFYGCSNLSSLNVSNFNTSNVTDMYSMFENCSNLLALDVSGFDTSKVTAMHSMFCRCSKLATLDVSGFKTSNVTDMRAMFNGCSNLQSLDVSSFDTSHVATMMGMFFGCAKLSNLDTSNFDTSSVTEMDYMFSGCSELTSIKTSLKFVIASTHNSMFPSPTKTASGLISDGTWGLGSETANKAYSASDLPNAFTADGTWYAQAKKYTVTLDANNGTGTMNVISIVNGSNGTLPANTFKRTGYKFTGWNTKTDGSGTAYADKATIKPTSDVTLYAQWEFVPCVIKIPKAISYSEMPVGVVSTDDSYDISVDGKNMYDVSITSATDGLVDGTATLNAIVNSAGNPFAFTGDGTKQDRVQIKGIARYSGKYKGSINYKVKVIAK